MKISLKILTIISLLTISHFGVAQSNKMFKELSGFSNADDISKINNSKVSSIEIINNTVSDSLIGIMPSEIKNTRQSFIVSDGIDIFLKKYINKFINKNAKEGLQLLLVVNDFVVGLDSSKAKAQTFIKVDVDVYEQKQNDFLLKGKYDAVEIADNSSSLEPLLQQITRGLILYSQKTTNDVNSYDSKDINISSAISQPAKSIKSIQENISQSNNFAILKQKSYKYGVYRNFNEFKNNIPSISNFVVDVDTISNKVKIFEFNIADSIKNEIDKPWGISVGNELYKFDDGQLYAIEKVGNFFALSKYLDPMKRENQAYFWRQVIGTKLKNDNPYDDEYIIRKSSGRNNIKFEAIKLDRNTGEIIL